MGVWGLQGFSSSTRSSELCHLGSRASGLRVLDLPKPTFLQGSYNIHIRVDSLIRNLQKSRVWSVKANSKLPSPQEECDTKSPNELNALIEQSRPLERALVTIYIYTKPCKQHKALRDPSRFRVQGLGYSIGFRVLGLGLRVQGFGLRVQGFRGLGFQLNHSATFWNHETCKL